MHRNYSNIFVLSSGRAGSKTFAVACSHLTNYTSSHESRVAFIGNDRLDYPANHIESDNRLSWFLGKLGEAYDGKDVLYVHLFREREKVAQSLARRWAKPFRASIIRAFANGIVLRVDDWPEDQRIEVCRTFVDTVNANIRDFVRARPFLTVHLEDGGSSFDAFLERIGAEGDLNAVRRDWAIRHNAWKFA